MAGHPEPLKVASSPGNLVRDLIGGGAAALVLLLTFGTLATIALHAERAAGLGAADWAAIRFTLLQATISAALSVLLALPVARALARRRFPGRQLLTTLLGAPFILPVIVAVLGLIVIFGRRGVVNAMLGALGLPPLEIYGFQGVVLAHVFFNMPLATRLFLQAHLSIPAEEFRLAAALGFSDAHIRRHLERPAIRRVLPGVFVTIFLLCLTSFAVALTLGGGPRATTIELAIYQAFTFDFDLGRTALLALVQLCLCTLAGVAALGFARPSESAPSLARAPWRPDGQSALARLIDSGAIGAAALFLLAPLGAVIARGLAGLDAMPAAVWSALGRSLGVSLSATLLTLVLAMALATLATACDRRHPLGRIVELVGFLPLATSPMVLGVGLFLLLFPTFSPRGLALPLTAVVNAVMSLPFALRALLPELRRIEADHGRLADSLGLVGLKRLRLLHLPLLRRSLGFAAGLTAALAMGDLGVIALFATPEEATLPMQIQLLMASYRMEAAAGAALLLLAVSLGLFWVFDRGGRLDARS